MNEYALPRYRRLRTGLLRTVIIAGFAVILGGMLFAFRGVSQILAMREDLARMTENANRLNSLSKDLLITENLFQTFDEWRECRVVSKPRSRPLQMKPLTSIRGEDRAIRGMDWAHLPVDGEGVTGVLRCLVTATPSV